MLSESNPVVRRFIRFCLLPSLYYKVIKEKRCDKTKWQILKDLLYIFFQLKYFPDNYLLCQLWKKERHEWWYYYGSIYDPYQRNKLRKEVLPFENKLIYMNKKTCYDYCVGNGFPLPYQYGCIDSNKLKHFILRIVKDEPQKKLIVKPVEGRGGKNIFLISQKNGKIFVKSSKKNILIKKFSFPDERYVVQEYILQHPFISAISPSINTIRIVTLLINDEDAMIIGAFMRFGIGNSFIDNTSKGGIKVGININDGSFMEMACDKKMNQYGSHPSSNFIFKGAQVPYWQKIVALALEVQKKMPFNRLIGMDIAINDVGPVIVEINDEYDNVGLEQVCGPILSIPKVLFEFKRYNLLINRFQKKLN